MREIRSELLGMAKSNKLKKLEKLRTLSKVVEKRKKLLEHYSYLITKSAVLEHDVQKLRAEVEELRQYMPEDIPADVDAYLAGKTSAENESDKSDT